MIKKIFNDERNRFLIISAIGIVFFFVPISAKKTALMILVTICKDILRETLPLIVLLIAGAFCLVVILQPKQAWLQRHIGNISPITKVLYVLGVVFGYMSFFQSGPDFIINSATGGTALTLVSDVFITVFFAGTVVTLISSFGLLQFVGVIIEPLMRPLYRLPGCAAMDIATSLTTSPAVDIYLSSKMYLEKMYTAREVSAVATNFSFCSFGFFAVLCEMVEITDYYQHVVLTSIIIAFIVPLVTTRIYPLSTIPDIYIDGSGHTRKKNEWKQNRLRKAWDSAVAVAQKAGWANIAEGMIDAVFFAVKTVCFTLSIATFSLVISNYTQFFDLIGAPFIPVLRLFEIPNASEVAPAVLVGLIELALPALLISGKELAIAARFFVVVLSTLQIIFLTESANAILESSIPLNFWKLIVIFLVRTLIAIPLVSIAVHILF